jgi:hypothetical protein
LSVPGLFNHISDLVAAASASGEMMAGRVTLQSTCRKNEAMAALVEAWLRAQGVDPGGDLCTAIKSPRNPGITCTAMNLAAEAGELGVCRFLWEHGAASTTRTKSSKDVTPMVAACECGHLHVAKWLFEVGSAGDIRTKTEYGGLRY